MLSEAFNQQAQNFVQQGQNFAQRSQDESENWYQQQPLPPQSQFYNDLMPNNFQTPPENNFANQQPWPQKVAPPTRSAFYQNQEEPKLYLQPVPPMGPLDFNIPPTDAQQENEKVFENAASPFNFQKNPIPQQPKNLNPNRPSGRDLDWDKINHESQGKLCEWFGNVLSSLGFDVCTKIQPK